MCLFVSMSLFLFLSLYLFVGLALSVKWTNDSYLFLKLIIDFTHGVSVIDFQLEMLSIGFLSLNSVVLPMSPVT